jgi:tRNA pseudouridine38-40 synthase
VSALDDRRVAVIGAGRTDAGVHAIGQVAAFTLEHAHAADTVVRALNARLPPSVRVLSAAEVPSTFHPQFDARAKTYRYRIWNADAMHPLERRYAWHLRGPLDVDAMDAAARLIEGEHDFAAFQAHGSDVATTVRCIASSRIAAGHASSLAIAGANPRAAGAAAPLVCYDVTGSGFLRHMVRAVVGSLVEIGRGRRPPEWICSVVESRDRSAGGPTAPAHGLFLVGVQYDPSSR